VRRSAAAAVNVDVRIISATKPQMLGPVTGGQFGGLFYRLHGETDDFRRADAREAIASAAAFLARFAPKKTAHINRPRGEARWPTCRTGRAR